MLRFAPVFRGQRIAVVIPAFNEERAVARTVRSVPGFVDHVFVIDDASTDGTARVVRRMKRRGLELVRHAANRGVGAAIATGYRCAIERDVGIAAVMAGDGQMDPLDLPALLDAVASGRCDYAKGNRFAMRGTLRAMPIARVVGNLALSLATKLTSGHLHVFDSQCGYTAASRRALEVIDGAGLFPRYGYPNDLLARLWGARLRVADVPVRAIYGPDWRSGISLGTVVYPMSFVLVGSFFRRLAMRYLGLALPEAASLLPRDGA
jgi:glycosyltransferase involved in cell wall biosynthesis